MIWAWRREAPLVKGRTWLMDFGINCDVGGLHPKTRSDFLQGSHKFSPPDSLFLPPQEPAAIMTDGERKASFQPPSRDEVRVPIAPGQAPSQVPQSGEEKDDDTFSACKSIQDSLASAGSSTRDPAQEGDSQVPYPTLAPTVFFCFSQSTRPRSWCLKLVCNPYPFSFRPVNVALCVVGWIEPSSLSSGLDAGHLERGQHVGWSSTGLGLGDFGSCGHSGINSGCLYESIKRQTRVGDGPGGCFAVMVHGERKKTGHRVRPPWSQGIWTGS